MSWREAARIGDVAFTELSFQAIYAFRQGNLAPPGPARTLVRRARRRVVQSKAVVSLLLALLAVASAFALRSSRLAGLVFGPGVPPGTFDAGLLTALFSLEVGFLWWTGMQVLPTFLASGVLPVLEPLPIPERTLRRAAGMLYLRLFDLPALTVLVGTPLAIGLALGPGAGLASLPGAASAVAFALALSLLTGRFFVRRVQGSRGGGGSTLVRWGYLVLWLAPAFAMFAFVTAAPAFLRLLGGLTTSGPAPALDLLLGAFPFPAAALPVAVALGPGSLGLAPAQLGVLAGAVLAYLALAAWAVTWVLGSVRRLAETPLGAAQALGPARLDLAPASPALAVLAKDLRIASRTPGYAFLILLPILDAAALGLWTYASAPNPSAAFGLGLAAVTTSALLATFFGPAFFAVEVFAYSYGRTLPLAHRSLVLGKVALIALIYLLASALVLGLALTRVFDPLVFAAFVLAEFPAVLAAAFLELGILFRRARSRGVAITNLYAGAWYAILVSIPGALVVALPLLAFGLGSTGSASLGLGAMAAVALGELALAAPVAFGRGSS